MFACFSHRRALIWKKTGMSTGHEVSTLCILMIYMCEMSFNSCTLCVWVLFFIHFIEFCGLLRGHVCKLAFLLTVSMHCPCETKKTEDSFVSFKNTDEKVERLVWCFFSVWIYGVVCVGSRPVHTHCVPLCFKQLGISILQMWRRCWVSLSAVCLLFIFLMLSDSLFCPSQLFTVCTLCTNLQATYSAKTRVVLPWWRWNPKCRVVRKPAIGLGAIHGIVSRPMGYRLS